MTAMTAMTALPYGRPLTRADLAAYVEALDDDGRRYELIDGTLIVSPAPSWKHQRVVRELALVLLEDCPDELELLWAPFAVGLAPDTEIQPDILVARLSDLTEAELPTAPVLAVEVLSPSTHWADLGPKREHLAAAGCPCYWVVDPVDDPRIRAWELRDGAYVEVAEVAGDEHFETGTPYAVRFRPAALTRRRGTEVP